MISKDLEVVKKTHFSEFGKHMKQSSSCLYPASRGLFSVVFAELTGARKRDLCPGSRRTALAKRMLPVMFADHDLSPLLLRCHLVSPHSHVTVRSFGNHGACSTQSVSTQGRSLLLASVSSADTTEKRPLLAGYRV